MTQSASDCSVTASFENPHSFSLQGIDGGAGTDVGVEDELSHSDLPRKVLGPAYEQLKMFHVKLSSQGELRGMVGPRELEKLWERHILNSAALAPFVSDYARTSDQREHLPSAQTRKYGDARALRIADIGSGAGFPGIVLSCMFPDAEITLIEPMERRVLWLREVVEELGLSHVIILRARAEELQPHLAPSKRRSDMSWSNVSRETFSARTPDRGKPTKLPTETSFTQASSPQRPPELFDIVTCRAVAPMTKLSGFTLPLLRHGGRLIALKGQSAQAEIDKARKEITKLGGIHPRVQTAVVGPGLESTHVVVVDKR